MKIRTWLTVAATAVATVLAAPASAQTAVREAAQQSATPVTCIGRIEADAGLRLVDGKGLPVTRRYASFDHFGPA